MSMASANKISGGATSSLRRREAGAGGAGFVPSCRIVRASPGERP